LSGSDLQRRYQLTDTLSITTSQAEGKANLTIFHLSGVLDAAGEGPLYEQARQTFEGGAQFLLLDMQNLKHISSAGLRALHNIFKLCTPEDEFEAARESGEPYKSPYFKLAGVLPEVYYVLNLAGFLHNIPFYPTLEEALKSFD
jgi:anti-anti-sigma regulatory factor